MKSKVYLSGAISGRAPHEYMNQFANVARSLRKRGWEVVSPLEIKPIHAIGPCLDGYEGSDIDDHSWSCCMRKCFSELVRCETVIMLPGWQSSHGARAEINVAAMCGLSLWYLLETPGLYRVWDSYGVLRLEAPRGPEPYRWPSRRILEKGLSDG